MRMRKIRPVMFPLKRLEEGAMTGIGGTQVRVIEAARACYKRYGVVYLGYSGIAETATETVWNALELAADRGWLPAKLRILEGVKE